MSYTVTHAITDEERQIARAFAVKQAGAPFCMGVPSEAMAKLIDEHRPIDLEWIVAHDETGELVGAIGCFKHPEGEIYEGPSGSKGFHHQHLVGSAIPSYTEELIRELCSRTEPILAGLGCPVCTEDTWYWLAVTERESPVFHILTDLFGGRKGYRSTNLGKMIRIEVPFDPALQD